MFMCDQNDKETECLIMILFYEWHLFCLFSLKKNSYRFINCTALQLQMKFTGRGAVPLHTRKTITLQCWE